MAEEAPGERGAVAAGLALVVSLLLLITPGTWLVTDQAEYLYAAGRLLDAGTLVLGPAGDPAVRQALPWIPQKPGQPIRSRLLPLTAITQAPLLALDRAAGLDGPPHRGRFVHLQGLLLVAAGLGVLAAAIRRAGGSGRAAAVAVVLVGLTFPTWYVARRSGPEPLLFALVAAWAWADAAAATGRGSAAALVRAGVLILAPWTNPTGAVVAVALVTGHAAQAWAAGGTRRALAESWPSAAWLAVSAAAFVLVWNVGYHGSWWAGGYDYEGSAHRFAERGFVAGLALYLGHTAFVGAPLLAVAALGWSRSSVEGARPLPALALTLALSALFATFYLAEPTRRLAPVWPAWGVVAGRSFDRLRPRPWLPAVVGAAALALAMSRFMTVDGRYYPGPGGLYYPSVLWVELAIAGHTLPAVLVAAVLLLVAARSAARLGRALS